MSYGNYDDRNSTVRWIPRWARGLLGLEAEYERPNYSRYDTDRRRIADEGVSWVPGFIRSWLGLDFTEPKRYGPSDYDDSYEPRSVAYTPPPAPRPAAPAYTPPPAARPAAPSGASYSQGAAQTYSRETSYTPPPAPAAGPMADTAARRASAYGPPPPPFPRVAGQRPPVASGADVPPTNLEGYVQPVGHLLRSYARGALPPQGLEQFTREARATTTDVWNLYSYWTRFQTEELFRLGRELLDAIAGDERAAPAAASAPGTVRRIRVTTTNGNGAEEVAAPPVATPAPPPVPPASTAVFSPTVTADDAAVPPSGGDPQAAFEARVAESAAEGGPTVESIAEAARSADEDAGQDAANTDKK